MSELDFPTLTAPGTQPKITDIYKDFTTEAIEQIRKYLEINPPNIPIAQILGFSQFTAEVGNEILTQESTSSAAYTNLATVGPELTGLSDGSYLVAFGATITNNANAEGSMSLSVNAATASDNDRVYDEVAGANISLARIVAKTLAGGGSNSIRCQYKGDGTNLSFFQARWLIALRYANK